MYILNVEETCTLRQLREMLFKRSGIPPLNQVLAHENRQLQEGDSLRENGIHDQSTLELTIQLNGANDTWHQRLRTLTSRSWLGEETVFVNE